MLNLTTNIQGFQYDFKTYSICFSDLVLHSKQECYTSIIYIVRNLLLPIGMNPSRLQMAETTVKIYNAEDLPKMSTDIVASIKNSLFGIFCKD